jgi:hypothetical protein
LTTHLQNDCVIDIQPIRLHHSQRPPQNKIKAKTKLNSHKNNQINNLFSKVVDKPRVSRSNTVKVKTKKKKNKVKVKAKDIKIEDCKMEVEDLECPEEESKTANFETNIDFYTYHRNLSFPY